MAEFTLDDAKRVAATTGHGYDRAKFWQREAGSIRMAISHPKVLPMAKQQGDMQAAMHDKTAEAEYKIHVQNTVARAVVLMEKAGIGHGDLLAVLGYIVSGKVPTL
jgi:hypothetical protein